MKVGFHAFGRGSLNYGLRLCINECLKRQIGVEFISVSAYNAGSCDLLLFSLYWWQHVYDYLSFLREAGLDWHQRKPLLIIGGFQSFHVRALGDRFHYACIGDGEEVLPQMLSTVLANGALEAIPGVYWPGKTEVTEWQNAPFQTHAVIEPGQQITRIEIARGCRYRCHFCALSYLKPYREGEVTQIKELIRSAPTSTVALFAPDRTSYSEYGQLHRCLVEEQKTDLASDVRWDTLCKSKELPRHIRFGLEGVSARLRRAVNKRIEHDNLLQGLRRIIAANPDGRGCHCYIILDLPGEDDADYEEFIRLLYDIEMIPDCQRLTLIPFTNSFLPNPHTPLQWAGIHPLTDLRGRFKRCCQAKPHWKFVLALNNRAWGPVQRVKAQLVLRGTEKVVPILENILFNAAVKKVLARSSRRAASSLLRFCEREGISEAELCGELPGDAPLPWEHITTYQPRSILWRGWGNYRKAMGLSSPA